VRCALLLLLVGCGRLGFDPLERGAADAPTADVATIDGATVPAGPALWLRMETDPTVAIIDSGGNHTSACAPSCPTLVAGKHGMGYGFTNQEIDVTPAADIGAATAFTGAVWFKLNTLPPSGNLCPFTKASNNVSMKDTFAICVSPGGEIVFDGETVTGTTDSEMVGLITLHTWHHVAFWWDGTTKRGFLDGMQVASVPVAIAQGSQGFAVGGARGMYFIDAVLDDALYYPRALSDAEIAQLATP
jgi:hypothetical protein